MHDNLIIKPLSSVTYFLPKILL